MYCLQASKKHDDFCSEPSAQGDLPHPSAYLAVAASGKMGPPVVPVLQPRLPAHFGVGYSPQGLRRTGVYGTRYKPGLDHHGHHNARHEFPADVHILCWHGHCCAAVSTHFEHPAPENLQ